jgi:hypothetical protein
MALAYCAWKARCSLQMKFLHKKQGYLTTENTYLPERAAPGVITEIFKGFHSGRCALRG